MDILLKKFGDILTSRQGGREAYAAFLPTLNNLDENTDLVIDFEGIKTFTPSWGDEFLTPIQRKYSNKLTLRNTENLSVALTISTLEKANGFKFSIIK